MKVAAVNWQAQPAPRFEDFASRFLEVCAEATAAGADLAVFPENVTYDLLEALPNASEEGVPTALSAFAQDFLNLLAEASRRLVVMGGTTFRKSDRGVVNSWATGVEGRAAWGGDKVCLTQYEKHPQGVAPGAGLGLLTDPRFGVAVCYDSEFPEAGRALAEAGALCFIVPAYTETRHGFHRVRECCRVRAIENQVYVIHSSLVGSFGREPLTSAVGSSAILAPCVPPFPADGVLAETADNAADLAIADLDFGALVRSREEGDVRNWHDRSCGDWTVRGDACARRLNINP